MSEHTKHRRELARSAVAQVEICDCGLIYLAIGPVTMKLSPEAFHQLARGVQEAARSLGAPSDTVLPFGARPVLS